VNYSEISESNGVEITYVHGATVGRLTRFLSADVPWVWILSHTPGRGNEWSRETLPLNEHNDLLEATYRLLSYDLLLETSRFLEIASKLENHGLDLIQSYKPMPSTFPDAFYLHRISSEQHRRILAQNGAFLRIVLPHAIETAQVLCFEPGYLATRLEA
jgi:hypothetical protein